MGMTRALPRGFHGGGWSVLYVGPGLSERRESDEKGHWTTEIKTWAPNYSKGYSLCLTI